MARTLWFALVFAGTVLAFTQTGEQGMESTRSDEQQLIQIEQKLAEATRRPDASVYEQYMAEDFIGINHNGQELTRAQILERLRVPGVELESLTHENIRVRVYGDCAIATARTVLKGRFQGQDVSGEFPYLRVWLKRNGRWQAVATQSTRIPPR